MGMDAYANIYYGFHVEEWAPEEAREDDDFDDYEWEEYYVKKAGIVLDENGPVSYAFQAVKDIPCQLSQDGEYGGWFVHISGAGAHGDWDAPTKIEPERMISKPEWDTQLKEFCELMGIEYQEPAWYLTCYYS